VQAELTPAEVLFLKERVLVVDGPGGVEVVDEQGRRYWPLLRRRLIYPGNPGGPVRTVLFMLPPGLVNAETWSVPVHQDPKGLALVTLGGRNDVKFSGGPISQAVRLEVSLAVKPNEGAVTYQGLQVETFRKSPLGDLYASVRTQGIAAAFPTSLIDPKTPVKSEEKSKSRRPSFGADPAAK